jgi:hypothetical protein
LRGEPFAAERAAYQAAIAKALDEDTIGEISAPTLKSVRDAAARIRAKLDQSPPTDRTEYNQALNYVKTLIGIARMLQSPEIDKILAELKTIPNTTLGSLLGFMHTFNLRFGPATTPRQRLVYEELYSMLTAHRDKVLREAGVDAPEVAKAKPGKPTEFFQGMHLDQLEGKKSKSDSGNPQ